MEDIRIQRTSTQKDILKVATLAHKIWNDHFVPIIGQAQVDYMLNTLQNEQAMSTQIKDGYEYYLVSKSEVPAGYLSIRANKSESKMMISKFYLDKSSRGTGLGKHLLQFVIDESLLRELSTIWLTVNRDNTATIEWYQRRGFKIVEEKKMDIGNGFFMDDFIMEMPLE